MPRIWGFSLGRRWRGGSPFLTDVRRPWRKLDSNMKFVIQNHGISMIGARAVFCCGSWLWGSRCCGHWLFSQLRGGVRVLFFFLILSAFLLFLLLSLFFLNWRWPTRWLSCCLSRWLEFDPWVPQSGRADSRVCTIQKCYRKEKFTILEELSFFECTAQPGLYIVYIYVCVFIYI